MLLAYLAPRQTSIWNFPSFPMFLDVLLMARMNRQKCRTLVCQFSSGVTSRCSALSKYTCDFSVKVKKENKRKNYQQYVKYFKESHSSVTSKVLSAVLQGKQHFFLTTAFRDRKQTYSELPKKSQMKTFLKSLGDLKPC